MNNVWDRTTGFLSDNQSALAPLALIGIFVPYSIWMSIAPLADGATPSGKLIVYGLVLLLGLWMAWGGLAVNALAIDPPAGRGAAARLASRRLLPMIGVGLLLGLGVGVLLLPAPIALAVGGFDFRSAATGAGSMPHNAAITFGFAYAVVAMIVLLWIGARLMPVNPVVVAERRGAGAIRRAFRLTAGIGARLFGVVVLYLIVSQVAELATQTVFGSVLQLIAGGEGRVTVATVLTSVLVAAVATIFTVLAASFTAKLYLALRDAREGNAETAR